MVPRLIINADDFGLTSGINRAIAELHRAGVLTSATLMATGSAFQGAVEISQAHTSLGIGCHIVLTDGIPVSQPSSIPTLLGGDGKTFRPSLVDFVQALLRGQIREDDIEREAFAQVQKLQRAGINVTHLDTHKHTHLFPAVVRPLLHVAERCSINAIRSPFEPLWTGALGHGGFLRRMQIKLLNHLQPRFKLIRQVRHNYVLTTDGTIGISATGTLNTVTLAETLRALPAEGIFELCCHPGYNDSDLDAVTTRLRATRDIEREALLAIVPQVLSQPHAPKLVHYGSLRSHGACREVGSFETNTGHEEVL